MNRDNNDLKVVKVWNSGDDDADPPLRRGSISPSPSDWDMHRVNNYLKVVKVWISGDDDADADSPLRRRREAP